jgi:hypothetical protein
MLRSLLAAALVLTPAPVAADWTECKFINQGPITKDKPPEPFVRQPDFAAASSYPKTEIYDGMPPERLRSPSPRIARVVFGHVEECGRPSIPDHPNAAFAACIRNDGIVYLPNPCDYGDREEFARLACHEQAHLAWAWPKDHGP